MRPRFLTTAIVFCAGFGCGGSSNSAPSPRPPATEAVTDTPAEEHADAGIPAPAVAAVLTQEDCEGLLSHIFKVVYDQKLESVPEDERPSPEDVLVAKDKLRAELFQQCVGADRNAAGFDCAMAAQTPADLGSCQANPRGS